MFVKLGVENLLSSQELLKLKGKRVALLCHAASINHELQHSFELIHAQCPLSAAFGPQHGMRGEKQDNMIESDDYIDPQFKIPVFSLYGKVRRPTQDMLDSFDILLVDLQDVGCRIYTFLTTLFYVMEACSGTGKEVWVLDRPNPAGRSGEGSFLDMDFESFVGAAKVPMRHGLTLGEMGYWYKSKQKLNLEYRCIEMSGYKIKEQSWPQTLSWVNPSPNIPRWTATQVYPGSVLLEGTLLSEGRGTTLPLEMLGAPGLDIQSILKWMNQKAPQYLESCILRPCYFEPTFHKFKGELCSGIQVHLDYPGYKESQFKPYRLIALFLKAIHHIHPEKALWRNPPYEYEEILMPIDLLSGDSFLREWVEDSSASIEGLEQKLQPDEAAWEEERKPFLIY